MGALLRTSQKQAASITDASSIRKQQEPSVSTLAHLLIKNTLTHITAPTAAAILFEIISRRLPEKTDGPQNRAYRP